MSATFGSILFCVLIIIGELNYAISAKLSHFYLNMCHKVRIVTLFDVLSLSGLLDLLIFVPNKQTQIL